MQLSRHFVAPRIGNGAVRIWPYAGKPEYLALLVVVRSGADSDKATSAGNQQERLIEFRGWVNRFRSRRRMLLDRLLAATRPQEPRGYRTGVQVSRKFVADPRERITGDE